MKHIGQFFAGLAILIIAAVIFLQNTTVGSLSLFYRINGVGVGPILLIIIDIHINRMSGLQLVLEIGVLCVGAVTMIKGMIGINSTKQK